MNFKHLRPNFTSVISYTALRVVVFSGYSMFDFVWKPKNQKKIFKKTIGFSTPGIDLQPKQIRDSL